MDIMVPLEQYLNRCFALLLLFIFGCIDLDSKEVRSFNVPIFNFHSKNGIFFKNKTPFTGRVFKLHENGLDTVYIRSYFKGIKNGQFVRFYTKNRIFEKRNYVNGKKEGIHIGYWEDGSLAFEYNLKDDEYNGSLKEWNRKGQIIKSFNYVNGYENGSQKLWFNNGEVKSNYVIKNNRRYGPLGTKNCINVSDSIQ